MECAVITGCDSGIGRHLAWVFKEHGIIPIVSFLAHNPFADVDGVPARKMDLRCTDDIESFSRFVHEASSGHTLKYLVNNAGVALGGPFEDLPMNIYREVFEINFFGLIAITRTILPAIIQNRGRLIVIGSLAGRVALPYLSPYTASKFALEGWCDSVRRELAPFGVATILIEPAGIATPIWNKALEQDASFVSQKYEYALQKFRENFILKGNEGMDTAAAARRIFRCITAKKPRPRYIIARNRLGSYLETIIPDRLMDAAIRRLFPVSKSG